MSTATALLVCVGLLGVAVGYLLAMSLRWAPQHWRRILSVERAVQQQVTRQRDRLAGENEELRENWELLERQRAVLLLEREALEERARQLEEAMADNRLKALMAGPATREDPEGDTQRRPLPYDRQPGFWEVFRRWLAARGGISRSARE